MMCSWPNVCTQWYIFTICIQKYFGFEPSCNKRGMFLPQRRYHHNLWSTDGLTILAWIEIVTILVHINHPTKVHTQWKLIMKPGGPLLLTNVNLHCGRYPACKVDISWHAAFLRLSRVTILLASSMQTLVHCVVRHSRPPDLNSSSIIRLPFA